MDKKINVRVARECDLGRINELRKQVNELHVMGKPEVFKPGFSRELQDYIYVIMEDPEKEVIVAEQGGVICGFAVLHCVHRPENPYMYERNFLDIDELGVDESYRRQGAGSALISYARHVAEEKGFRRVELNMWEFNREALAFYESMGFVTYRRYMEINDG